MSGGAFLPRIIVSRASLGASHGLLMAGGIAMPCALGRAGIAARKREGDGATPAGEHRLVAVFYRPDHVRRPRTGLPVRPLRPDMGWCDDPADPRHNREVRLPFPAGHERLWRDDGLYDIVVVLDYNLRHPQPGAGSAVFFHLASPGFSPTAGCVAISLADMTRILRRVGPDTVMTIA